MSDELVKLLRDQQTKWMTPLLSQAADRIEALTAEREALLCAMAHATTELRQSAQDVHAIRAEAALTNAYRAAREATR